VLVSMVQQPPVRRNMEDATITQACKAGRGLNLNLRDEADCLGFPAQETLLILKQSAAHQIMTMLVCLIDLLG
jgi:hypothetical protein